jgi:hypothetical protein
MMGIEKYIDDENDGIEKIRGWKLLAVWLLAMGGSGAVAITFLFYTFRFLTGLR